MDRELDDLLLATRIVEALVGPCAIIGPSTPSIETFSAANSSSKNRAKDVTGGTQRVGWPTKNRCDWLKTNSHQCKPLQLNLTSREFSASSSSSSSHVSLPSLLLLSARIMTQISFYSRFLLFLVLCSAIHSVAGLPELNETILPGIKTTNMTSPVNHTSMGLHLSITATPPDPLGMSKVNGFYGPGGWITFNLWILASWWRIIVWLSDGQVKKIDPNAWGYLLAMNCASIDMVRLMAQIAAPGARDVDVLMSALAAADTIIWTGMIAGILQALVYGVSDATRKANSFGAVTILVGLLLPAISQTTAFGIWIRVTATSSALPLESRPSLDKLPAFYWNGQTSAYHCFAGLLTHAVGILACLGIIFTMLWLLYLLVHNILDRMLGAQLNIALQRLVGIGGLVAIYFVLMRWLFGINKWTFIGFPFLFPLMLFYGVAGAFSAIGIMYALGLCTILGLPIHALVTFCKILSTRGRSFHESCFFMPCTPYSLLDTDQAFGSLLGAVMFFGIEIAPPLYHRYKKARDGRRLFEEEINRRIADAVTGRAVSGVERVNSGVERVNSGIEMGNVTALSQLSQRTNSGISRAVV